MTMTRAQAETILVSRVGGLMEATDFAVSVTGSNASLNDSLAWSARQLDLSTADPSTITDVELAALGSDDYDSFLNLAEYRTLCSILTNLAMVDVTGGPRTEKYSQLANQAQARLDRLEPLLTDLLAPITTGYIQLDFAEHGEL